MKCVLEQVMSDVLNQQVFSHLDGNKVVYTMGYGIAFRPSASSGISSQHAQELSTFGIGPSSLRYLARLCRFMSDEPRKKLVPLIN